MPLTVIGTLRTAALLGASLFVLPATAATVSCNLKEAPASAKVYLYEMAASGLQAIDSTTLSDKGEGKIESAKGWPKGVYYIGSGQRNMHALVLEPANIKLNVAGTYAKLGDATVTGSKETEAFDAFYKSYQGFMEKVQQTRNASKDETGKLIDTWLKEAKELQNKYGKTTASQIIASVARNPQAGASYFSASDFTDADLARTPALQIKANLFYNLNEFADANAAKEETEKIFAMAPVGSAGRHGLFSIIVPFFADVEETYAAELSKKFIAEYPASKTAKSYATYFAQSGPQVGDKAPEIVQAGVDGQTNLKLSDLKGRVVLLDFWASWCGPCRRENPNVVAAYNKYKDRGFTVFSVSLDQSKDKWLAAIDKDQLAWPTHVSDLQYWNNAAAKIYGVRAIPAAYLIDKDGTIIGKNLRGKALDDRLEQVLGRKQ